MNEYSEPRIRRRGWARSVDERSEWMSTVNGCRTDGPAPRRQAPRANRARGPPPHLAQPGPQRPQLPPQVRALRAARAPRRRRRGCRRRRRVLAALQPGDPKAGAPAHLRPGPDRPGGVRVGVPAGPSLLGWSWRGGGAGGPIVAPSTLSRLNLCGCPLHALTSIAGWVSGRETVYRLAEVGGRRGRLPARRQRPCVDHQRRAMARRCWSMTAGGSCA
jgi:hypothetical protein